MPCHLNGTWGLLFTMVPGWVVGRGLLLSVRRALWSTMVQAVAWCCEWYLGGLRVGPTPPEALDWGCGDLGRGAVGGDDLGGVPLPVHFRADHTSMEAPPLHGVPFRRSGMEALFLGELRCRRVLVRRGTCLPAASAVLSPRRPWSLERRKFGVPCRRFVRDLLPFHPCSVANPSGSSEWPFLLRPSGGR